MLSFPPTFFCVLFLLHSFILDQFPLLLSAFPPQLYSTFSFNFNFHWPQTPHRSYRFSSGSKVCECYYIFTFSVCVCAALSLHEYMSVCLCLPCQATIRALTHTHAYTNTEMVARDETLVLQDLQKQDKHSDFHFIWHPWSVSKGAMNQNSKLGFERLCRVDSRTMKRCNAPKHGCGDKCWMPAPGNDGKTSSVKVK